MSNETPKPMTDEELLTLIGQYERASLGSQVAAGATISTTVFPSNQAMTTLEIDRYNALNAYFARPLGNEVESRSQVVLPEIRDALEWIVPQLMRIFTSAKTVCRFDAENPQDEAQAELETAVINHIFMQQNNGFFVLHDFFKDALLLRNGYVEVYTAEKKHVCEERYTGLTQIELAALMADKDEEEIEVIEQREYQRAALVPMGAAPSPASGAPGTPAAPPAPPVIALPVFDVRLRRTGKRKQVSVCCLPPEEMRVSPRAREGMEDIPFAAHITTRTRSDLVTDGYDPVWVDTLQEGRPNWLEIDALARNQVVDQLTVENPADRAMQEIEIRKVVLRVDYDGDGIAELRRVLVSGDKIGENEVIEETPFASCTPKRMPHRHTGISIYDEIMDLQIIKTTLWRQGLDNLVIANNSRVAVDWRSCNFEDLLTSRPNSPIRGEGPPANWIMPLQMPTNLVDQILPTLQYLDEMRASRIGVGRSTMGLDADELQDVTKGAMLAQMSAASLKLELIARLLAEGVKDIFRKIHGEFIRNQDQPLAFEIAGQWQTVDPSSWRHRSKVTVNVGLGSGNREELRANVMMLAQMQGQLGQMGLVGPKQAYETFKMGCEALGFSSPERFAMDPSGPQFQQHLQQMQHQPPPPNPALQIAQIKAQSIQAQQQATNQREVMKLQGALLDSKARLAQEEIQHQRETLQGGTDAHRDREVTLDSTHAQILMTLMRTLGPIIAAQLKGIPDENAGDVLATDAAAAQRGVQ